MTAGEILGAAGSAGFAVAALVQTVRLGRAKLAQKSAERERDEQAASATTANERAQDVADQFAAERAHLDEQLAAAREELANGDAECMASASDDAVVDVLDGAPRVPKAREASDRAAGAGGDDAARVPAESASGAAGDTGRPRG